MSALKTWRFTGGDVLMKQLNVNPPIQLLWRVSRPLDVDLLTRIHANLVNGPLNRRMVGSRLPLARPVWAEHVGDRPLRIDERTLAEDEEMAWADAACTTKLDAHAGLGWELSAANVAGGRSIVSLVSSHALADGQGAISAVTLAVRNASRQRNERSRGPSLAADLSDALTEGGKTYARLALARYNARAAGQGPAGALRVLLKRDQPAGPPAPGGPPPVRSRIVVSVEHARLEQASSAVGGSVTGLMLAMVANILKAARGTTQAADPFTVALPVSFRKPDDLESSNMVGIATVELDGLSERYTDLADIRKRSKAAYASVAYGRHLTGYPQSDASLSNLGSVPAETKDAFGAADAMLCRTVSGGGGAPGRMNCFMLKAQAVVSIAFQSSGVLVSRELVDEEFQRWGIGATHWW